MTPDLWASVAFFMAGIVGTACRSLLAASQTTFSRKSFVDIVIGGVVGILYPLYPLIPLAGNLLQQAAMIAFISYVSASVLQNAVTSRIPTVQATLDEPRLTSTSRDKL